VFSVIDQDNIARSRILVVVDTVKKVEYTGFLSLSRTSILIGDCEVAPTTCKEYGSGIVWNKPSSDNSIFVSQIFNTIPHHRLNDQLINVHQLSVRTGMELIFIISDPCRTRKKLIGSFIIDSSIPHWSIPDDVKD
jgi:hypothetical protein